MSFNRALSCGASTKAGAGSNLYLSKTSVPAKRPQILTPHLLHIKLCVLWLGHLQWCEKGICHPHLLANRAQHRILPSAAPPGLRAGSGGERTRWGGRETTPHIHNHTHTQVLHQVTLLRGMQPGQDLGRTEPLELCANRTQEWRESLPYPYSSPTTCFQNRR